jgi:pimeloyl-ACP methyl ester carboxylesterase
MTCWFGRGNREGYDPELNQVRHIEEDDSYLTNSLKDCMLCGSVNGLAALAYAADARLVVFEHGGHFPYVEEAALFAQTLGAFLRD